MRLPNRFNGYGADNGRRLCKGGGLGGVFKKAVKAVTKPVGSVLGSLTGADAAKAQEKAMRQAEEAARQQAAAAEQQMNAANAKSPDIDTIKAENASGLGSTMLTGSEGVALGEGSRKKKTLLGE